MFFFSSKWPYTLFVVDITKNYDLWQLTRIDSSWTENHYSHFSYSKHLKWDILITDAVRECFKVSRFFGMIFVHIRKEIRTMFWMTQTDQNIKSPNSTEIFRISGDMFNLCMYICVRYVYYTLWQRYVCSTNRKVVTKAIFCSVCKQKKFLYDQMTIVDIIHIFFNQNYIVFCESWYPHLVLSCLESFCGYEVRNCGRHVQFYSLRGQHIYTYIHQQHKYKLNKSHSLLQTIKSTNTSKVSLN